jgi:hypothetical protein
MIPSDPFEWLRCATSRWVLIQTVSSMSGAHSDVVAAQRFLNVVKRIADLSCECLTSHAMDNMLVLPFGKFGTTAKRLP